MTETPESEREPVAPPARPNRLYQAAAWVIIVAGTVFVASVIFLAGVCAGNGGWRVHHHHHGPCMMHHGPPPMFPGPEMEPEMGPGPGNGPVQQPPAPIPPRR